MASDSKPSSDPFQVNTLVSPLAKLAPRGRAVLTMLVGTDVGRVMPLQVGVSVTLGRRETSTYRIDDPSVSNAHARIVRIGPEWVLADERSTNGTYLNGERMAEPAQLKDGDRIQLGPSILLRFSLVDEAEEEAMRSIYDAALRDAVTGTFNRKHLDERLDAELAYARRHKPSELSIVMMDLDHFKRINDTHGHLAGDAVLKGVASVLARTVRTEDLVARYGGEEFVVVARDARIHEAVQMAERLRQRVAAARIAYEGHELQVTVSAGVASLTCCGEARDKAALLALADGRLYAAKQAGRNRVVGPT